MALQTQIRTKPEWLAFFVQAGIPQTESDNYATIFSNNRITELTMGQMDNQTLTDLEIDVLGDRLSILQHIQTYSNTPSATKPIA